MIGKPKYKNHSNGYRIVYLPEHPKALKSRGYNGWVYEHVYLTEIMIGRSVKSNEVIHHLDGNPMNNRFGNLLILDDRQHLKLHKWLSNGASGIEKLCGNRSNSGKSKVITPTFCPCGATLQEKQKKFCNNDCSTEHRRKNIPSKEQLIEDWCEYANFSAIGRKYDVSNTAVKKWYKMYDYYDNPERSSR